MQRKYTQVRVDKVKLQSEANRPYGAANGAHTVCRRCSACRCRLTFVLSDCTALAVWLSGECLRVEFEFQFNFN